VSYRALGGHFHHVSLFVSHDTLVPVALSKKTLEVFSGFVCLLSIAVFKIFFEFSLVNCSFVVDPLASTWPKAIRKVTLVVAAVSPLILSLPIWLALLVRTCVLVSVWEQLLSLTFFEEIYKLSSEGAGSVVESPFAVLSIQQPPSLVKVAFGRPPDAEAIFRAISPLSLKDLPVVPWECSVALSDPIDKLPLVHSVNILLATVSLLVVFVLSLKNGPFCDHEALSISLVVDILSKEYSILWRDHFEMFLPDQPLYGKLLVHWLIPFEEVHVLVFLWNDEQPVFLLHYIFFPLDFWFSCLTFVDFWWFAAESFLFGEGMEHRVIALFFPLKKVLGDGCWGNWRNNWFSIIRVWIYLHFVELSPELLQSEGLFFIRWALKQFKIAIVHTLLLFLLCSMVQTRCCLFTLLLRKATLKSLTFAL